MNDHYKDILYSNMTYDTKLKFINKNIKNITISGFDKKIHDKIRMAMYNDDNTTDNLLSS
jgi:hypothetical protein